MMTLSDTYVYRLIRGAKMVPGLTKPPCTEIRQDKRRYAENLDFKPFSHGVINIYEGL